MCWNENSLKDVWISLYQNDMCSKVKGVHSQIIGPFMLLERTFVAFKELGQSYVSTLQEVYQIKSDLDSATNELKILREKLNETQKPCENCEILLKDLTLAKKRASEAEFRVTQIAKILVVNSSTDNHSEDVKSPSKSPKRKKACLRDKCDNANSSFDSQTVEVGFTNSQSPANKDNGASFQNKSLTPRRSPRILSANNKNKGLSKSADYNDELSRKTSPRRNLSFEFETISGSNRQKILVSDSKNNVNDNAHKALTEVKRGNESFDGYSNKFGSELDKLCLRNDGASVSTRKKNKENSVELITLINPPNEEPLTKISPRTRNKNANRNAETEKCRNTPKSNRTSRSDKTVKHSDNTYELILEKKVPKKKFKQLQLTLQVKETVKQTNCEESDSEDLIMPSPNKLDEAQVDEEDLESLFAPGATSTQKPVDPDLEVLVKGKTQSPAKQGTRTAIKPIKNIDNSFDVILDKRGTKTSPNYMYKGKTVRGKARAQLQGWECDDCQKFYEIACKDQSPSKVKAKMNLCSRHRSKHKARPLTPPGFWDIDIPDTPE